MKIKRLKAIGRLLIFAVIYFLCFSGSAMASDGTSVPDIPDNDDLKRTMECNWSITNTSEPTDPQDYINDPNDDLVKLAASLDYNPVKICAWVYNKIYYPQYLYNNGLYYYYTKSRLGARGTYLGKHGNTWDQSSLLITLLRISGIPARYVRLNSTDIVYVEAYIEQDNYYGSAGGLQKAWVPMVPWLKEIDLAKGLDLYPTDGTITDPVPDGLEYDFTGYVSSIKYQSPIKEYEKQLQDYLNLNYPGKSIKDISFKENLIDRTSTVLPRSLPKNLISRDKTRYAQVPDAQRNYIQLYIINKANNSTILEDTIYLPEVAGKKFALDWDYTAGTSFTPVFKIDGDVVKTGTSALASTGYFYIKYKLSSSSDKVTRPKRLSGTYIHMGFDPLSTSVLTIEKAKNKLNAMTPADTQKVLTPSTHEEYLGLMGQVLVETFLNRLQENSKTASGYFNGINTYGICPTFIYTKYHDETNHPILKDAESKFYYHPQWNIDAQSSAGFLKWDQENNQIVELDWSAPIYQTQRWLAGYSASFDEGRIFEDWMDTPSASTIKGLMLANIDINGTNNEVVELTKSDIVDGSLPILAEQTQNPHTDSTISSIVSELEGGATVITPIQQIYYEGLEGSVRITRKSNSDGYLFGMDNGGSSSAYTTDDNWSSSTTDSYFKPSSNASSTTTSSTVAERSTSTTKEYSYEEPSSTERVINAVADPVDLVTGEFYTEEYPDLTIKSRGLDLSIVRQYKSRLVYNGPFGHGWAWNHSESLLPLANGGVQFYDAKGRTYEISYSDGSYVYPSGSRFVLEDLGDEYRITYNESRLKLYFYNDGRLKKKVDRFSNTLTYEYNSSNFPTRITKIKDALGQYLILSLNTDGKVESVTDSFGRSCRYLYDGDDLIEFRGLDYAESLNNSCKFEYLSGQDNELNNHNMTKYTLPGGDWLEIGYYKNDQVAFHTNAKGDTFNFLFSRLNQYSETWNEEGYYRKAFYNENGDVVAVHYEDGAIEQSAFDDYHNMISRTDGNGNTTTFQYYPDGTATEDQDTFAKKRKLYKETDALGHVRQYWYDDTNNPFSPSKVQGPEGRVTQFVYNADGSLSQKILAPGYKFNVTGPNGVLVSDTNAAGFITTYEYDAYGNITQVTDPLGNNRITAYDTDKTLPISITDADGNQALLTYYESGNAEGMPPQTLKIQTLQDGEAGYTTTYEYDPLGRKTKETNALGLATEYKYTVDGKLETTTFPSGAVSQNIYDTARDIVVGALIIKKIDALGKSENYAYNATGKLISKIDRNRNETSYQYDPLGRPAKIIDPLGNAVSMEYDGNGNVVAKTDGRGFTTTFIYDAANRLIQENTPCDKDDSICTITKLYEYYNDGKKKKETLKISDENHENIVTYYEYDALGHLFQRTDGYGSDNPQTTEFHYDALGRLVQTIRPLGDYAEVEYDAVGNRRFARKYDRDGTLLAENEYEYDARGLLIRVTDPMGNVTDITYDDAGRKIEQTNPEGYSIQYDYDEVGNVVQTIDAMGGLYRFDYDLNNRKVRSVNPLGETTAFAYDPNGNQTAVILPDQSTTRYFYDAVNRKIGEEDRLGFLQLFEYDASGNITTHKDAKGYVTTYEYDAANRPVKTIDAAGHERTVTYDEAGRKLRITDARGAVTDLRYDAQGNLIRKALAFGTADETVTRFEYDQDNRKIQEINELATGDVVTEFQYDDRDLLTAKTEALGTGDEATTLFSYDDNANVLTITNARDEVVSFEYNELNQKIIARDSDETYKTFAYDANGNPATTTRQDGTVVTYTRDILGRTIEVKANNALQQRFEYDALSRMTLAEDYNQGRATHAVTFTYNDQEQKTTETQGIYSVTRWFDGNENKTRIAYPSGKTVDKSYDETNFLAAVNYRGSQVAEFTPDEDGRIISADYANQTHLTLTYDTIGREDSRTFVTPASDPLFNVSGMSYDGRGSITGQTETLDSVTTIDVFTYDNLDRLTARTQNNTSAGEWDYDLVGNWEYTDQNGTPETRSVTGDNEYDNVGGLLPDHDSRGNMTFDGNMDYEYDWANRLIRVTSGVTVVGEYTYDALNRRVTKTANTVTTTCVYDDGAVVEEYENAVLSRSYVYGNAVDDPILVETGNQVYYYTADIRGSIRAITNSTGALVESYEYNPFGLMTIFDNQGQDITATGSTIGNPYGYTGRRWDGESGLWYYRNRMYSAELGRFLQRDPAGYVDGVNLYSYVLNNPLRFTDPEGLTSHQVNSWTQAEKDKFDYDSDEVLATALRWRTSEEGINTISTMPTMPLNRLVTTLYYLSEKKGIDVPALPQNSLTAIYNAESAVYHNISATAAFALFGVTIEQPTSSKISSNSSTTASKSESYLFRGTTEGYAGRYGVSPTSTDPAVATHFAIQTETMYGGKGVVYVIPESSVGSKILPPQYNALPYEFEVPLDISPLKIPSVSSSTLTTSQARTLLRQNGIEVPSSINSIKSLTEILKNNTPMTAEQISIFVNGAK